MTLGDPLPDGASMAAEHLFGLLVNYYRLIDIICQCNKIKYWTAGGFPNGISKGRKIGTFQYESADISRFHH